MKRAINIHVESGDTVELGEIDSVRIQAAGNGASVSGVQNGDDSEYVVVKTACEDGREFTEWPSETQILGVTDGSGMQSAQVWGLIPLEAYA